MTPEAARQELLQLAKQVQEMQARIARLERIVRDQPAQEPYWPEQNFRGSFQ